MSATIEGSIRVEGPLRGHPHTAVHPKRGELLVYRPRPEASPADREGEGSAPSAPGPKAVRPEDYCIIRCCGREFRVRQSMARIFLRRARDIVAAGEAELVPLLHADGVDLLLITPSVPLTMLEAEALS